MRVWAAACAGVLVLGVICWLLFLPAKGKRYADAYVDALADEISEDLKSREASVRLAALRKMKHYLWRGPPYPSVARVLRVDPIPEVRVEATRSLRRCLYNADVELGIRRQALMTLVEVLASDPDARVRYWCLVALWDCSDKEMIPLLARFGRKDTAGSDMARRLLVSKFPAAASVSVEEFETWWAQVKSRVVWDGKCGIFELADLDAGEGLEQSH